MNDLDFLPKEIQPLTETTIDSFHLKDSQKAILLEMLKGVYLAGKADGVKLIEDMIETVRKDKSYAN